jgi:hypothetical protein
MRAQEDCMAKKQQGERQDTHALSWDDLEEGNFAGVGLGGVGLAATSVFDEPLALPDAKPAAPRKTLAKIKQGLQKAAAPSSLEKRAPESTAFKVPGPARASHILGELEDRWRVLMARYHPQVIAPKWDQYMRRDTEDLIALYGTDAAVLGTAFEYLIARWDRICARFTRGGGVSVTPSLSLLRRFHADIVNEALAWREIQEAEEEYRAALLAAGGAPYDAASPVIFPAALENVAVPKGVRDRYTAAQTLRRKYSAVRFD